MKPYGTISELLLDEIRRDILSGRLKPGAKIDQNQLKKRFGVSLIPLREALKRLQSEGYVEIEFHRGVRVKPLSREEIDDLYLVRAEVEALAARLAVDNLTEADFENLRSVYRRISELTEAGAYEKLLNLNRKFHYTIYRACRRKYLLEILDELWTRSSRYRNLATVRPARARSALKEHYDILQACTARDPEALAQAIRINVDETRKMIGPLPAVAAQYRAATKGSGRI